MKGLPGTRKKVVTTDMAIWEQRELVFLVLDSLKLRVEEIEDDLKRLSWWQWKMERELKNELEDYNLIINILGKNPILNDIVLIPNHILDDIGWEGIKHLKQ